MSNKMMGLPSCPAPTFTPARGLVGTNVTITNILPGSYIFYTNGLDAIYPKHTGPAANALTTVIGDGIVTPSAVVSVSTGTFLRAITYKKQFIDSPITGGVDDGSGKLPVGYYGPVV